MPPPLPGLSFPPPPFQHTSQASTTPIAFPPRFPPQPLATPIERVQEVMDSDREDGEVSDADASSRAAAGMVVRQKYPEPPRSAPQSGFASRAEETYNPDKPSAGQATPQALAPKVAPHTNESVQQQREEAKQFIRLLNSNNIGYHALAKENIDIELLRGMYRSMNLPSEPEPIPPPKTNGTAASKSLNETCESSAMAPTASTSQRAVPAVSTNVAAAPAANTAASPVDRKDYLARLQAAKLARQSGPAKASPPQKSPPVTAASSATGISTPQATMTPTRKQPVTDEQKARQTELIKQRLEALKAQSKQSIAAPSNVAQKAGLSQVAAEQPRTPGTSTPTQQTSNLVFQGIPGLFMNAPPNLGSGTATPSRQPQSVPQKRHTLSDTEVSTPRGSVTPYNRTFGQSPHTQQEDSMIIEVSDDESNGSDMDIDDDHVSSGPPVIRQTPVSIPGFPPRQAPVPAAHSSVSTPGPQTPATLARTGELSTKEQELAALKLTLKKKLAEQKRIKEAAEAAASASVSASTVQGTPSDKSQAGLSVPISTRHLQTAGHSQQLGTTTAVSAGTSAGDSSRDRKRRRRTEIQEQLPSLDDEIASNEAEMLRLAKDLERLKANNERIVQDKRRLTKELEDLGIDTEGMSHADMRATKNKIERAMSPEVEGAPQIKGVLSQSSLPNGKANPVSTSGMDAIEAGPTSPQERAPVSGQSISQYGFLPGIGQATPRPPSQFNQEALTTTTQGSQAENQQVELAELAIDPATLNDRASATPLDDDEDFYSPPPPAEVDSYAEPSAAKASEPVPDTQKERSVADAPSLSEEGEVEMSESSEGEEEQEDYEPEESVEETQSQVQLLGPQAEQSQSIGQSQVSTEEEEAYEPPDVDEEAAEHASTIDAAQIEPSSPGDADDGAMDIATSSSEDSEDSDSDSNEEMQSEFDDTGSQTHMTKQEINIADDIAPELQSKSAATDVPVAPPSTDVRLLSSQEISLTKARCPL